VLVGLREQADLSPSGTGRAASIPGPSRHRHRSDSRRRHAAYKSGKTRVRPTVVRTTGELVDASDDHPYIVTGTYRMVEGLAVSAPYSLTFATCF